jgi:gliding motility-associated-like protein
MKRITITLSLFILPLLAFAQPVNDDCGGLIDLGVAPACPDTVFFNNIDATASDIGFGNIPECFNGGTVQNDVWFAFTTSDTIFDYTITLTGLSDGTNPSISNPQIAIYRGDCSFDNLAELACESAEAGATFVELDIAGLTPNITYFIRINDYSATATPNWGSFQLCVDETEPASTIDEGGSTSCSGVLFDSGGEEGDYENNEDYTFTICPDQPHECIIFTLDYYFIEVDAFNNASDVITFYDGENPTSTNIISQIGGFDFAEDGGGGVCYQVQATSGCLTINFASDGQNTFEGFAGHWECSQDCEDFQPVTTDLDVTDEDIVDFVSTASTQATITSINCPEDAYALFEAGDNTDLGLERGLLMTSGDAPWAVGPNNNGGGGNAATGNNFAPGDPDLDYLSGIFGDNTLSNDACVIELDVLAATNELTFEYVFGSEEYPEFVNSGFNDIFAFLISGPGIAGDPGMNNQLNIATLPNGMDTPVQINSVNNITNWQFYRNNEDGLSIQYDGLTSDELGIKKSLTARAEVQACSTYHLKFAIADRGDFIYDSGVFISELKGGTPNLSVQFNSGIDYLVEDCVIQPDEIIIELNNPVEDTTSFAVNLGGTATLNVDYLLDLPDTITFAPGQTLISFPIQTLSDLEVEPTETITISLSNNFGCGEVVFSELVIDLQDQIVIEINIPEDTVLVCQDSSIVLEALGGASYFWSPVSIVDNPTEASVAVSPETSQWLTVEGVVGPCIDYDSVFLQLVSPEIIAEPMDTVSICQGDTVQLLSTNNVNDQNLQWLPIAGLNDPNDPNPLATPQTTTEYVVSVDVAGCFVYDTVFIDVSPFDFPEVIADTLLCQNYSVQLASTIDPDTTTTTFAWTPDIALDDPSLAGATATPMNTVTYTLIGTSANEACADTAEVLVQVFPADVDISNPDTVEICLGDTVFLEATTSTGTADGLIWSPDNGTLSDTFGLNVQATPTVSGWYYSTFNLAQCTVFDSVFVRVDSLPDLSLTLDPEEQPYCQGDIVTISSTTFEPSGYPDIEHLWTQGLGFETPDTLFNMVFTAQDTVIYQRITTNRACIDTAEILVNVIQPPLTSITPQDTSICLGESVQFLFEISGQYDSFTWSGDGLSCTDCFDPLATPTSPGVIAYTIEIEAEGCESSVGVSINVVPDPIISLTDVLSVCPGNSVLLNEASDNISTYTWTSTDPDFGTITDPMPLVTPDMTTTYFLTADNGVCPPIDAELTIDVVPPAEVNLSASMETICAGDEITITAEVSNGNNGDRFIWIANTNSDTLNTQNIVVAPDETTTYTLIFISGAECDTLQESITIDVLPQPVVDLSDDAIICLGESIQLNNASDGQTIYTWSSNDPGFTDTDNPEPIVTPAQSATYVLFADNGFCPPFVDSVFVEVVGNVSLDLLGPTSFICAGDSVSLVADVTGGSSGDTYTWTDDDGNIYTGDAIVVAPDETTTYSLSFISGPGCDSLEASYTIEVEPGVNLNDLLFEPDTNVYYLGDVVTITAELSGLTEGLIFSWFENDTLINSGADLNPITVTLLEDGMVNYSVTVETPTGCDGSIGESIEVVAPVVDVPNVFTPNNDQVNDFFNIVAEANGELLEIADFRVFNRWGQMVYDNDDPANGWDGRFNDQPQPTEAYFYQIKVFYPNGELAGEFKGNVTLLR